MINMDKALTLTEDPPDPVLASLLRLVVWNQAYGQALAITSRDLVAREVFFVSLITRGGTDGMVDWMIRQKLCEQEDLEVWDRTKTNYANVGIAEMEKSL